jgi:hypothetical protein
VLHLATPLLAALFCYLALSKLAFWRKKWIALLLFIILVAAAFVAMVFFRSADVPTALRRVAGMAGFNGYSFADPVLLALENGYGPSGPTLLQRLRHLARADLTPILVLLVFVWTLPNTQQWMRRYPTALDWRPRAHWLERWLPATSWRPVRAIGVGIGVFSFFALARAFSAAPTEFLYFQF